MLFGLNPRQILAVGAKPPMENRMPLSFIVTTLLLPYQAGGA